jgi:hypothetical protein
LRNKKAIERSTYSTAEHNNDKSRITFKGRRR